MLSCRPQFNHGCGCVVLMTANTLLVCFEAMFFDCLLYPREKHLLLQAGVLQKLRNGQLEWIRSSGLSVEDLRREDPMWESTKGCMYHHFGAIHLLRLLVIVLVQAESPSSKGGSSHKKKRSLDDVTPSSGGKVAVQQAEQFAVGSSKEKADREEMCGFVRRVMAMLESYEFFPYLR